MELRLLLWAAIPLVLLLDLGRQAAAIHPARPAAGRRAARRLRPRPDARLAIARRRSGPRAPGDRDRAPADSAPVSRSCHRLAIWRVRPLVVHLGGIDTSAAALVIGVAGAVVMLVGSSNAWRQVPGRTGGGCRALVRDAAVPGGLAGAGDDTVERMAEAVRDARHGNEEIGTHQVFVRNLVFYAGTRTIDLITDEQIDAFMGQPSACAAGRAARRDSADRAADRPAVSPAGGVRLLQRGGHSASAP